MDVVTVGEPLVQLNAVTRGPLRHVTHFERHVAGAELNFAIGCVRLGLSAGYVSRIGADEFGRCVLSTLRGEGVDVSQVRLDATRPTGVYFVQRGHPVPEQSQVLYYRGGSAASVLGPADVNASYVAQARLLHLTGITPALSASAHAACRKALRSARAAGRQVSFDTNLRPQLWTRKGAWHTLLPFVEHADIVVTDPADCEGLIGERNAARAARRLLAKGVKVVAMKLGTQGAVVFTRSRTVRHRGFRVPVEDPIGAGDAFAAGLVASLLQRASLGKALETGVVCGPMVVTTRGDWENLPKLEEVPAFLGAMKAKV